MCQPSPHLQTRDEAYAHLSTAFPSLKPLFSDTNFVGVPAPNTAPVHDALAKIVVGQMLSQAAATTIHARLEARCELLGCESVLNLPEKELRNGGLSARKAATFRAINEKIQACPTRLDSWCSMDFDELRTEVASIWGLSDWSAAMLAIFHFGHVDVFPESDGSLKRAIKITNQRYFTNGAAMDHNRASPFRSYLAMTLWAALDKRLLRSVSDKTK